MVVEAKGFIYLNDLAKLVLVKEDFMYSGLDKIFRLTDAERVFSAGMDSGIVVDKNTGKVTDKFHLEKIEEHMEPLKNCNMYEDLVANKVTYVVIGTVDLPLANNTIGQPFVYLNNFGEYVIDLGLIKEFGSYYVEEVEDNGGARVLETFPPKLN